MISTPMAPDKFGLATVDDLPPCEFNIIHPKRRSMSRTPQYKKLLANLKAGKLKWIEQRTLKALLKSPDGLTRQQLIRQVFHQRPKPNLNNDINDRKIRKAIESLRNQGVLIVSTSGGAGYQLDADPEAIQCMLQELKSRIVRLQERVDAIEYYHPKPDKKR